MSPKPNSYPRELNIFTLCTSFDAMQWRLTIGTSFPSNHEMKS